VTGRHREVWFGILFGAGLWPLDAAAASLLSGGGSYSDWVGEVPEVGGGRKRVGKAA
jgi:hypothetical protein